MITGITKIAGAVVTTAVLLTGCASTGGMSAGPPEATAPAASDVGVPVRDLVARLSAPTVALSRPSDPVDVGTRTIGVVAAGLSTAGARDMAGFIQQAADAAGWTVQPVYDGKFTAATQAGHMVAAMNAGAQALMLIAVNPATLANALQIAQSRRVPVVCVLCGPDSGFAQFPGMRGISNPPDTIGRAQADYVIEKNDRAKVWIYQNRAFPSVADVAPAAVAEFEARCRACETHVEQFQVGDDQQPGTPVLAAVLARQPVGTIDYILVPYDPAAANFASYLQQLGRTDVGVVGSASTPQVVSMIRAGDPTTMRATVSAPLTYQAWASIDVAARMLNGLPVWDSNDMPSGLISTDNVTEFPSPSPEMTPDFDFRAHFLGLWGKR